MRGIFLAALVALAPGCIVRDATDTVVSNVRGMLGEGARSENEARAREGDVPSQFALGNSYCCGAAGFVSTKTALEWYCKAARQGHLEAQIEISKIHGGEYALRTPTVRPDRALALMWLEVALSSGKIFADDYRKSLMARVSPEEAARARRMRKNWKSARCEI
ncbi:MAG: hypothetical protein V3V56_10870 [bacterium]